jgi:prophage regulatory protein
VADGFCDAEFSKDESSNMPIVMLRLREVLARKKDSRSSTYNQINAGLFPPPVKISERASAWPDYETDAINAARIANWSNSEIKLLVSGLVELREIYTYLHYCPVKTLCTNSNVMFSI